MHERVDALEERREVGAAAQVGTRDLDALAPAEARDVGRGTDERAHLVAVGDERGHHLAAEEAVRAGDEHPHAAFLGWRVSRIWCTSRFTSRIAAGSTGGRLLVRTALTVRRTSSWRPS